MTHRPIRPGIRTSGDDPNQARGRPLSDVFSFWVTGVTVVTLRDAAGLHGVTVSAFTPLSHEPPLVLLCLSNDAPMLTYIRAAGRFTVNLLASTQKRAAGLYADRFVGVHARFRDDADAILDGALASFACSLDAEHIAGDHCMVIGRVQRFTSDAAAGPLLYFRSEYRTFD
jgi:flavin reductase (DIM6/NTAB) family NADH-FMN oxidoreductase RutF